MTNLERRRVAIEDAWAPWVPRPLGEHIAICAEKWGYQPFFITDDIQMSYRDVDRRIRDLAAALHRAGVNAGDRVGVLIGNTPDMYLMKFAVARLGALDIPLNYLFRPPELSYVIGQSRLRMIVGRATVAGLEMRPLLEESGAFERASFPTLQDVLIEPGMVTADTIMRCPDRRASEGQHRDSPAEVDAGAITEIIYTSGSTGRPKGTMLTHDGFLRNAYGTAYARALPLGNRTILSLPPFHRFGYGEAVLSSTFVGGALVLEERFDCDRFLERVAKHRVTDLVCVARMAQAMMDSPRLPDVDLSSLTSVLSGGDVVPEAYWQAIKSTLGIEEITTAYGMTEHGISFLARPDDPIEHVVNTVGSPKYAGISGIPDFGGVQSRSRIVDPVTNREVEAGSEGEIQFAGPCVTPGYWDNPAANGTDFIDGWHRSGDMGRLRPDGCLILTGRLKEMYRSGGENVIPREVELVIDEIDGVVQSYVVGVKDEKWGEAGCACVVLEPTATVTADKITDHCKRQLARYKVPKYVIFLTASEIPTTTSGKIKKIDLVPLAITRLGLAEPSEARDTAKSLGS